MRIRAMLVWAVIAAATMANPSAAQVVDHLGVPGPIEFHGKTYALAWSSEPADNYVKQEYVPAGQKPETFSQLLLLERVTGGIKVMDAVRSQVDMLKKRKATDPLVNFGILEHDATGEVLLDFVVSTKDDKREYIVEWNAYRYTPYHDPAGNSGVLLFGLSQRAYGNDNAKAFMASLKQLRRALTQALVKAPLPRPTK